MSHMYTPARNGFAQSSYADQMGTALAGSLAFASDRNLVDACAVGAVGADGLEAGRAVVMVPASGQRAGINHYAVVLPGETATSDQIAGVVVRTQQMSTNAAGRACWFERDVCNLARRGRSGARVWVRLADGEAPEVDGAVYVRLDAANAGKFAAEAGENALAVAGMVFRSQAREGVALVELM